MRLSGNIPLSKPIGRTFRRGVFSLHLLWILVIGGLAAVEGSAAGAPDDFQGAVASVLTNAVQVRDLTVDEAKELLPVRMRGVVTYIDNSQDWLFVQDASGGVFVMSSGMRAGLAAGQEVEVTGISHPGTYSPFIFGGQFKVLGSGVEPSPLVSTIAGLWGGKADGHWVEVAGVVGSGVVESGRLTLQLVEGNEWLRVVLQAVAPDWRKLINARVRLRGVCAVSADKGRRLIGVQVFVPANRRLIVEEPPPTDPFALPILSIADALAGGSREVAGKTIRIRAVVEANGPGGPVMLRDRTGSIGMELTETNDLTPGLLLDAVGSRAQKGDVTVLRVAACRRVGIVGTNVADFTEWTSPATNQVGTNVLTSIQRIRSLNSHEAARALPVRVRGVVTYYDPSWDTLFVQGNDAGIYVNATGGTLDVNVGDQIELEGATAPGDFVPVIIQPRFEPTGRAPLPRVRQFSLKEVSSGAEDSQWVGLQGIVRSAREEWGHITLEVADAGDLFEVVIPDPQNHPAPTRLVDAKVRLKGVCGTIFNQERQLIGVRLFVPGLEDVEIDQSPPEDPFALPRRAVGSLLQFSAGDAPDHRVLVRGTVTLCRPGQFIYLQDDSGGIMVRSDNTNVVEPGALVDAVGFPAPGNYTPVLDHAIVRTLKSGHPPRPLDMNAGQALGADGSGGIFDAKLVSIQAHLLDLTRQAKEQMLVLQAGAMIFNAYLESGKTNESWSAPRVGSQLELTGVCSVQVDANRQPNAFRLYLRSPADVRILKSAPWWTFRHTAWALTGFGAILLMAIGWVVLLRSQVQSQTLQLQQEVEEHKRAKARLEAEMAERKRMELEIEKTHRELLVASRHAGMAEVATGVLHNVGNVLNSVNVSASLIDDRLRRNKLSSFARATKLIKEHAADLPGFFTRDSRAVQLPVYLDQFGGYLQEERRGLLDEVAGLRKNIEHIKDIVAMQQSHARVSGVIESIRPAELLDDALRLNSNSIENQSIEVIKEFEELPPAELDRHKVLQILVNFLRNAKHACEDSGRADKRIILRLGRRDDLVLFSVIDNGVGIAAENLTRIFNHGFTTRKDGHGFGLHSGANAAREMGGRIVVESDGPGRGATFTLDLPLVRRSSAQRNGGSEHARQPSPRFAL